MELRSDLEIAQSIEMKPIEEIAKGLGIDYGDMDLYGKYKAKVDNNLLKKLSSKEDGKLILVTAITPTPAGEGKTTTTVGLGDALQRLGKKSMITLREPSLGPVFGVKGGAAGGGYAQVVPMEDINLHFTGDLHAITAANNLLAAIIDNHIYQGNKLNIDNRRITWKRCIDMNDRQLRNVVDGLGGRANGFAREDGFDITVASEIMAILCLSGDLKDLKERINNIVIGYNNKGRPVTAGMLKAQGAMAALLKDAMKPNLVQTLEHTPAFIHGGPFANIAHGCNSVVATGLALKLADYVVTEAGFGADLGCEKFIDIKCRMSGLRPSAVVVVATVRALKHHGGAAKEDYSKENLGALERGIPNLLKHIENVTMNFGLPAVVAINKFPTDTKDELDLIEENCRQRNVKTALSEVWEKGSSGGEALAREVIDLTNKKSNLKFIYPEEASLFEKIRTLVKVVYGGEDAVFTDRAEKEIKRLGELGFGKLPVCMAKTQYSLSDDPKKIGRPEGFKVTISSAKVSAGAGFVVVLTGDIMTMPGLPKIPAAETIDVDENGRISGLF